MMQKRISSPKTYSILRKVRTWTVRIRPGPHKKEESIPLALVIRDSLNIARNARETKKILKKGEVLVDGVIRKDHKFPVGFMDVIIIPKTKKYYRMTYTRKGKLVPIEIKKSEADLKIVRIKKKIKNKDGFQIVTHDGRTFQVKKTEGRKYKTGSSLLIKIPSQEILEYIELKKGANAFITGGKHIGAKAQVKDIRAFKAAREDLVVIKIDNNEYETVKRYIFPIGIEKVKVTI